MNILDIITKKKNGKTLSYDELKYAFNAYLNKDIPDYQMSALLMAITINGMTLSETLSLTDIFIRSGEAYDLTKTMKYVVDKHSTGGVGDSTTLVIGPMCAALGLHMAKMSGRGLGLTGGTIDKVESIPGFNINLTEEEFYKQVEEIGFALSSQTADLVPLDKVIYALRDVTGTTESIPLIASSIMSKKIAAGANNILIDIKVGSGALIKNESDARVLSDWLIQIGEAYKRKVKTIISDMNAPLSYAIGNSLEVCEAINVLRGKKCPLYNACVEIVANLLSMAKNMDYEEAEIRAEETLKNGSALKKFYQFVTTQGGRLREVSVADKVIQVKSKKEGEVTKIDALGAAKLASKLGASRLSLNDNIDYTVGIILNVKIGDKVKIGDTLLNIYMNKKIEFNENDFEFIEVE
ncbi:MAG: thymidine phosphorylase [Erysipelotrichales bacterium]|nr:thymidine phosphorylase [Erysipelotrichales bacterium]